MALNANIASTGSTTHRGALSVNPLFVRARAYFASDRRRAVQTILGLLWLLDGALQFQPFMYSQGFVQEIQGAAAGQPLWLENSINWAAHLTQHNLAVFNTSFALVQVLIGVGLLCRRTVKPALALSFVWVLIVWWFGEAFGMLFMMMASPLSGAPGAVLFYALIGLAVWPMARPGGLLGVRGTRMTWAAVWLSMAWLWLAAQNSAPGSISTTVKAAPSGVGWVSSLQHGVATAASGHGLIIALGLALLSVAVGVAVAVSWRPQLFLGIAAGLGLMYWVVGQGLGGIFTGSATDPNSGPLIILFAFLMYSLIPYSNDKVNLDKAQGSTAAFSPDLHETNI